MQKFFFIFLFLSAWLVSFGQYGRLVWQDEFESQSPVPDSTKWTFDLGDGCPSNCGWGNNQKEYYTNDLRNARIEEGRLILEAHRNNRSGHPYTSARITTRKSLNLRYGRIDVRARLPRGHGTWPAIWMLPSKWEYGGWPRSGEIDIMEHVGWAQDSIFGTVHTQNYNHIIGTQQGKTVQLPDASLYFNDYSIVWTEEKIDFLINGKVFYTYKNDSTGPDSWPFDKEFYLIMNLAIGGNFGGVKGVDDDIWPQRMEVEYVRVYN
ncbi:MAG: glycoside hydrolase family 16 protein [Saprospiraceae bacterium]|nr:glycoside hydrolase family 16 protein [Candidatus Parvibacillus calidus]